MRPPVYNPDGPESVKALYEHDMREIWDRQRAPQIWTMYHDNLRRYFQAAGSVPSRILDVGCAQGTLALLLAERGHRVCAMDIRPPFLDYARSRHEYGDVTFIAANAMEYDCDTRFDLIFANQILEHLVYPRACLARLTSWLAPGGRVVCTTPNGDYIKSSLPSFSALGNPDEHAHRQFSADGDGHFFAYTASELDAILRETGLQHVGVFEYDTPWMTGHMKVRHVQPFISDCVLRALDRCSLALPAVARRWGYQLWAEGRAVR